MQLLVDWLCFSSHQQQGHLEMGYAIVVKCLIEFR